MTSDRRAWKEVTHFDYTTLETESEILYILTPICKIVVHAITGKQLDYLVKFGVMPGTWQR